MGEVQLLIDGEENSARYKARLINNKIAINSSVLPIIFYQRLDKITELFKKKYFRDTIPLQLLNCLRKIFLLLRWNVV